MIYLVLSAVTLALLYGVYRLVLSRTTLHRFNRTVLLSILVLSFILPAVRIDAFGDSSLLHVSSLVPEPTISGEKGDSPQLHDEVVEAMGVADMTEAPAQIETGAISSAVQTIETAAKIMNISAISN